MTDMIFSMSMRFTYIDVSSLRNYYEFSIKKFVFQKYFYIIYVKSIGVTFRKK